MCVCVCVASVYHATSICIPAMRSISRGKLRLSDMSCMLLAPLGASDSDDARNRRDYCRCRRCRAIDPARSPRRVWLCSNIVCKFTSSVCRSRFMLLRWQRHDGVNYDCYTATTALLASFWRVVVSCRVRGALLCRHRRRRSHRRGCEWTCETREQRSLRVIPNLDAFELHCMQCKCMVRVMHINTIVVTQKNIASRVMSARIHQETTTFGFAIARKSV